MQALSRDHGIVLESGDVFELENGGSRHYGRSVQGAQMPAEDVPMANAENV